MTEDYSPDVCRQLARQFAEARLHRPMKIERYDPGEELEYELNPVDRPGLEIGGRARLRVESFVGGGFAGQVYRVRVLDLEGQTGGLVADRVYALKILLPPSGFSTLFRNALYAIGFQGPFQIQVNLAAARAGALWQKFIRRGAAVRFGASDTVNDVHALLVDRRLGSCGEISDWVAGRTWRLEVDDRMDLLAHWRRGSLADSSQLGSPEYRAKAEFMRDFVGLLCQMGAYEFARQYEWTTCKSQPNCLKRSSTDDDPASGLVAVDFRAGLTLLPFLPMSPGDVLLILKGLCRGSLVQFDRGSLDKLSRFVHTHSDAFEGMQDLLQDLKSCEEIYRNSVPDITHNHVRLLYSSTLWGTMLDSAPEGWKVRGVMDESKAEQMRHKRLPTLVFALLGLIPLLGGVIRKAWGSVGWRRHYGRLLSSRDYLRRALRGKMIESVSRWYRAGRVDERKVWKTTSSAPRFFVHACLSVTPVALHKLLTDWSYLKDRFDYIVRRPVRLYFNEQEREQWLRDMVQEGRKKHIISHDDAQTILSRIKEPFIQKYLKSLAVHICTAPVTQVVSVLIAMIYVLTHPEMPRAQAWGIGLGIIALFQIVPISPGSLTRGLYVLYLVIRERNFRDYNIAVFLGFFKYVGYLAFPIQMTYRYPALARFMAAHWATEAVHVVPVFGERGALLEHWVFRLFYNWPLTIRRRMRRRAEMRAALPARYWHGLAYGAAALGIFASIDLFFLRQTGGLPAMSTIWYVIATVPLACGALLSIGCGGASLSKRIAAASACGAAVAAMSAGVAWLSISALELQITLTAREVIAMGVWRLFAFTLVATLGAIAAELSLPDPDIATALRATQSVGNTAAPLDGASDG